MMKVGSEETPLHTFVCQAVALMGIFVDVCTHANIVLYMLHTQYGRLVTGKNSLTESAAFISLRFVGKTKCTHMNDEH